MTSFVYPNLKFHNQYCTNHQVFPQHPTQQAPPVQDPIENDIDADIEYVSTGQLISKWPFGVIVWTKIPM